MDEEAKDILFARERQMYVEATVPKNYTVAEPLARAHDGFNEEIDG